MSKRWYVVHAYSGFENQVRRSLEDRVQRSGLQERFGQVLAGDTAIVPEGEMKRVAPVDHDENRLQEVITVRSTSGHVEEQVEFGRSLNIVQRNHWRIVAVGVRVRRCGSVEDQLQGRDRFRTGSTR